MKYTSLIFSLLFIFIIFSAAWPFILFLFIVFVGMSIYLNIKRRAFQDSYQRDINEENSEGFNPFQQNAPDGNQYESRVENPQVIDAEYTERQADSND